MGKIAMFWAGYTLIEAFNSKYRMAVIVGIVWWWIMIKQDEGEDTRKEDTIEEWKINVVEMWNNRNMKL